jgi:hypothetical protein
MNLFHIFCLRKATKRQGAGNFILGTLNSKDNSHINSIFLANNKKKI